MSGREEGKDAAERSASPKGAPEGIVPPGRRGVDGCAGLISPAGGQKPPGGDGAAGGDSEKILEKLADAS